MRALLAEVPCTQCTTPLLCALGDHRRTVVAMNTRLSRRYRHPRAFTIIELALVALVAINALALMAWLALALKAAVGVNATSQTGSMVGVVAVLTLVVTAISVAVIAAKSDGNSSRFRVLVASALYIVAFTSYVTTWGWLIWAMFAAASPWVIAAAVAYVLVHLTLIGTSKYSDSFVSGGQTIRVRD
jgi:amino acid transporter